MKKFYIKKVKTKWRLYRFEEGKYQDTVIRDEYGDILNKNSQQDIINYCMGRFGNVPYNSKEEIR